MNNNIYFFPSGIYEKLVILWILGKEEEAKEIITQLAKEKKIAVIKNVGSSNGQ